MVNHRPIPKLVACTIKMLILSRFFEEFYCGHELSVENLMMVFLLLLALDFVLFVYVHDAIRYGMLC